MNLPVDTDVKRRERSKGDAPPNPSALPVHAATHRSSSECLGISSAGASLQQTIVVAPGPQFLIRLAQPERARLNGAVLVRGASGSLEEGVEEGVVLSPRDG